MAEAEIRGGRFFVIEVKGQGFAPALAELSAFLYDLNLAYEISRLATDPTYEGYEFSRSVWYRTRKPLREQDRLHVASLSLGSPLHMMDVLAATTVAVPSLY
jgi:hypothetical protein